MDSIPLPTALDPDLAEKAPSNLLSILFILQRIKIKILEYGTTRNTIQANLSFTPEKIRTKLENIRNSFITYT